MEDLEVRYGSRRAVGGLSLELHPGTITALVGGDGAGKTSVLRALAGTITPELGTMHRPPAHEIGYMSAGPGIYFDLSVHENLWFAGRAYGVSAPALQERSAMLLERTGLSSVHAWLVAHLSGGMRQKLALAVTLIHEPRLVLLDEPTTGVDPVSRAELWRLIARVAANGAAVLLATSYVEEAERAGHLVVLADGMPLLSGASAELVASVPGALYSSVSRPRAAFRWRRGRLWRAWSPDGRALPDAARIEPDLEDAVVIAELARGAGRDEEAIAA
ncbi:MAG: ABC transporter ATP-binding protein [Actinomycetota bacterium]